MRIAITGATGFLGRHAVIALLRERHEIRAIVRQTTALPHGGEYANVRWHLADDEGMVDALADAEAVIHLANSYGRPEDGAQPVLAANVVLPMRLLELAVERRIPFVSGDTFFRYNSDPNAHLSLYAASKRAFSEIAAAIAGTQIAVAFLVIGHMYGPGDDVRKGIPSLLVRMLQEKNRIPLTSGIQERDFVHVEDVAQAIVHAVSHLAECAVGAHFIPVGSGRTTRLRDFLVEIHRRCGSSAELGFGDLPMRRGEPCCVPADISQLREWGWVPRIDPGEGIDSLIRDIRARIA